MVQNKGDKKTKAETKADKKKVEKKKLIKK